MRIIISPAKKMNVDTDTFPVMGLPEFLAETRVLMEYLKKQDYASLKRIWKCNDRLTALNQARFKEMELERNLTPAILSYEGLQYQYMAPKVMEETALEYLQEHLRILSGFYGILKPFDGVTPYRLEMQARLGEGERSSLYAFWGSRLAQSLGRETETHLIEHKMDARSVFIGVLNLASKEYSRAVIPHLGDGVRVVTAVFGQRIQGKIVEKGTLAKMARGEMVRFLAETGADTLEEVRSFTGLGYRYCEEESDGSRLVFLKE